MEVSALEHLLKDGEQLQTYFSTRNSKCVLPHLLNKISHESPGTSVGLGESRIVLKNRTHTDAVPLCPNAHRNTATLDFILSLFYDYLSNCLPSEECPAYTRSTPFPKNVSSRTQQEQRGEAGSLPLHPPGERENDSLWRLPQPTTRVVIRKPGRTNIHTRSSVLCS